jgi:hypothetical protein
VTSTRSGAVTGTRPIVRQRPLGWTWALVAVTLTVAVQGLTGGNLGRGAVPEASLLVLLALVAVGLAWTSVLSLQGPGVARAGKIGSLVLAAALLGGVGVVGAPGLIVQGLCALGVGLAGFLLVDPRS